MNAALNYDFGYEVVFCMFNMGSSINGVFHLEIIPIQIYNSISKIHRTFTIKEKPLTLKPNYLFISLQNSCKSSR